MKLSFKDNSGVHTLTSAINYIDNMADKVSDMRPVFRGMEADIITSVQHEFDKSNPNHWRKPSESWKTYKRVHGYPENTGIYTGQLMNAASTEAIKKYYPTNMTWIIAPVYSQGFTINRKIGITTGEWLRTMGRRIAAAIMKRNTVNG